MMMGIVVNQFNRLSTLSSRLELLKDAGFREVRILSKIRKLFEKTKYNTGLALILAEK